MSTAPTPESRSEHPERVVKVQEAKTRLVPIEQATVGGPRRPMGFLRYRVPDSFFEDLPDDELQAWEGGA